MEVLSPSAATITPHIFQRKAHKSQPQNPTANIKFPNPPNRRNHLHLSFSSSSFISFICFSSTPSATLTSTTKTFLTPSDNHHWMVLMEAPPQGVNSKPEVINYYVNTLARVLGREKDAQMCIYHASCDSPFGFCCDIDEDTSRELARLPEVLSVRPDPDYSAVKKTYSSLTGSTRLFPVASTNHWLVRMDKPGVGVVTKAQMVDYYAQALTKVLGNEKDAQMCIYHVSWLSNFGFCCELDDESARELAGIPGVLSVLPDKNFESENKDYGGNLQSSMAEADSSEASQTSPIKTKKLFITGLSFYTSEKTLRTAFEGFGELVEVKIIMDRISKRSKGYAFIEYTTEEAASTALKEMNGKIINGWMIVVDVAKTNPPRYSRSRPR
ncbi:hypothetical protein F2P56_010671 [Juglans regia]|uniref:Organelle RRM domain-containing protein 1, chloroplastic-like n=2 Tax=Juglans regia TaxID=51240 RepID=A0A2I4ET79_JUGRE|nr:organelle RRM domain-containing protein 1, chloroplastic-like [Juglans regia]KAF5470138.1 hypothetical protein F2P56_010671 [Juglans regia]